MTFGHFDDARKEYVITTPQTPYPWINYLGCESFFGLISNTGGGYCFYRDARLRRLTRYRYDGAPLDGNGRYFYINDGGEVWNPGWQPVQTELDHYECRHGLGYTRITGEKGGLQASVLYMVPLGENAEVHHLTLTNRSQENKSVKLFSFVEFCLWDAQDDATNFQRNYSTGEVEIDGGTIYHKTEYRERRNHFAFYSVNAPVAGFDTDRESFTGLYNGFGKAEVPFAGSCRNSVASGWRPIASHQVNVDLAPGETRELIFVLGYIENEHDQKWAAPGVINKEKADAMRERFADSQAVADAQNALQDFWEDLLGKYQVSSGDEKLNRMVNIWNPYQCMVTFNMSRSASYFESGIGRGMGFRDSNQDLLGFVHQIPQRARQRILDIASTQFEDGGNWHQYQPLTRKGNADVGGGFNDDPLWLILGAAAYIKETGDWSILDEPVTFDDSGREASLFEHCKASFDHVVNNLGPHGLPLIGRADWNDCLNLNCFSETPGESFQTTANQEGRTAESVFIAGLFAAVAPDYATMARHLGRTEEAACAEEQHARMAEAVLEHGWDGEWFLRAYDYFGNKVGGRECQDGQIYIEPQGYCSMAGIGAEEGRIRQALDSVRERLNTPHGIVILDPPYRDYHVELGEVSSYPPGYKENAGVFCHNNPWVMIAEALHGRADYAWEYYRQIAPAYIEEQGETYRMEPYVYAQMIAGKTAVNHGEAKNSWLTGTAAWNYVAVSQYLLGVRPDWDGLRVEPCIDPALGEYDVVRVYRGAVYRIHIQPGEEMRLLVNGQETEGQIIPPQPAGAEVEVVYVYTS